MTIPKPIITTTNVPKSTIRLYRLLLIVLSRKGPLFATGRGLHRRTSGRYGKGSYQAQDRSDQHCDCDNGYGENHQEQDADFPDRMA
jgi:hypothetical protein